MKTNTIETLIWVLIYGGLLAVGWGISVQRSDGAYGLALMLTGAVGAAVGLLLIYVRSRMKGTP